MRLARMLPACAAAACAQAGGENARADRYLRALAAGDCAAAYRETSPAWRERVPFPEFQGASCLPSGVTGITFRSLALVPYDGALWVEPAIAPTVKVPSEADRAREVVMALGRAAVAGDFAAVHALLAAPIRARYTPERLAREFARAGEVGRERALALAAGGPVEVEGSTAFAPQCKARLLKEDEGWRLSRLE